MPQDTAKQVINQKGENMKKTRELYDIMTKQYNTITMPGLFNLIAAKRPDLVYRIEKRQLRHKQTPDGSLEPVIEWYNDDNAQVILINGDDDQQYTLYNSNQISRIIPHEPGQPDIHTQTILLFEKGYRLVSNTDHRLNEAYESESLDSSLIEIGEAFIITAKHNIYNDKLTLDRTIRNVISLSSAAQCFNHDRVVTSANNLKELLKTLHILDRQCDHTAIIEALRALNQEVQLISNDDPQLDEVASLKKPVKTTLQDTLKPLLDYYGRQTILDEIEEIEYHNEPK